MRPQRAAAASSAVPRSGENYVAPAPAVAYKPVLTPVVEVSQPRAPPVRPAATLPDGDDGAETRNTWRPKARK